jgi:hypothetical protein
MKKVICLVFLVSIMACQAPQNQFTEVSPEIESVQKSLEAFLKQDWTTFRSIYADTAKIAVNTSDIKKFINND